MKSLSLLQTELAYHVGRHFEEDCEHGIRSAVFRLSLHFSERRELTIEGEEKCKAQSILRHCQLEVFTQAEKIGIADIGSGRFARTILASRQWRSGHTSM